MVTSEREMNTARQLYQPFTMMLPNGCVDINIDHAKNDQLALLVAIMTKVREWISCATSDDKKRAKTFKPLRMTVCGSAGAGKSFFIKCLANTVWRIFGHTGVMTIAAPTGAAAYNVGGETVHRTWGINPCNPSQNWEKLLPKGSKRPTKEQ